MKQTTGMLPVGTEQTLVDPNGGTDQTPRTLPGWRGFRMLPGSTEQTPRMLLAEGGRSQSRPQGCY